MTRYMGDDARRGPSCISNPGLFLTDPPREPIHAGLQLDESGAALCGCTLPNTPKTCSTHPRPPSTIIQLATGLLSMSQSSQTYSFQAGNQHVFNGVRDARIGKAIFNNVGRDQFNQNLYTGNPLWEAIADVGASHNSEQQVDRDGCMPGTREAVLNLIRQWRVPGCQSLPVCWLSGAAGVGKSAIALSVAEECEEDGLVASFFFFRSDPKRNNASSLILSIAHGLVVTRPHLKPFLDQKIAADPRILKARLEDQYKKLILQNLNHPPPSSTQSTPDLVIIDGLDECGDAAMQRRVLSIIFSTYQQLFHHPLRFLICSRPESWIRQEFCRFSELTKHIKLDDSFCPQYDIELYLNHQFLEIRRDPQYSQVKFPYPWPTSRDVELLVEKADGQFIYPSIVIKFVKAEYALPTEQLCIILNAISNQSSDSSRESPLNDLDELYLMVLRANPDRNKRLLPILAVIVVFSATSSPAFIEFVLGHSPGTVSQTLRAMHSVLDVRDDWGYEIRIYHKSFTDFLFDQARSREFFIDESMWKDSLACRWTRALVEQCRKDPELLIGHKNLYDSLQGLVEDWNNDCLSQVDGCMSNALMSEVDAFYHLVLSISVEFVGHDMLLHILAAILLLPSDGPRSPNFIQLLLGLCTEALDQTLHTMDAVLRVRSSDMWRIFLHDTHPTFRDFLFDRSRSKSFFIEKDDQSDFLARKCLRLFQMDDSPQDQLLLQNWARVCTIVDNPTEELLLELNCMDLGVVLAKSLDYSHDLFRDFETISTWLTSKTDSVASSGIIDHFENVQRGYHIRRITQDVQPGFHDDVVTMIIMCPWILQGEDPFSLRRSTIMRHLFRGVDYNSPGLRDLVKIKLRSAEFCRCSRSDFECVSTPMPSTDLYHISFQAGCARVFKGLVASLGSLGKLFDIDIVKCLLVLRPGLLTRCLPLPELLPHFRMLLDFAKTLGVGNYRRGALQQSRELLSWLEKFPAYCAHEIETIRNDLLSL
ncbi:hypothetical protein E1B28_002988 [Marasmius oreades]|uniref:Nephrocystin 3-like N-terminal domain-containing protein n=1 Tax=Marasmius oreades TaxID=181124 RepID=A0A9P7UJ04_9AGAR|nr:uncharacterized protein E1B28_002988 [Marasmius oreades]KAG7085427.1 hypothetical protein E1B28_002988 [Marasmius oreades]